MKDLQKSQKDTERTNKKRWKEEKIQKDNQKDTQKNRMNEKGGR